MFLEMCKNLCRQILNQSSYKKSHPSTVYNTWRNITGHLVSQKYFQNAGLNNVWQNYPGKKDRQIIVAQSLRNVISGGIIGSIAEFGCYEGHTAIQMIQTMQKTGDESQLFLFDSFEGVPQSNHPDDRFWKKGELTAEYTRVKDRFASFKNVQIVKGYFKETLPQYPDLKIKFAHVDADLYVSIKEVNEWLFPKLQNGSIVIYDDYGFETCPGAMKAVDEDFAERFNFFKWYLPSGQLMVVKIT